MNAKELALARINANPQLMSMPLAMLTLGMEPKHVIDICVNVLDPIAKRMQGDHFLELINTNVAQLIEAVFNEKIEAELDEEKIYKLQATLRSLLNIYNFAQELRVITLFFKINQGVTAKYTELLLFIRNLSNSKIRLSKSSNTGIDIELLFGLDSLNGKRETYQEALLKEYDSFKTGCNIMDVILTNSNFRSMLEAMVLELGLLKLISGAARFVDLVSNNTNKYTEPELRKVIKVYQHFITGKALGKMTDIAFTISSLEEALGMKIDTKLGDRIFTLDNKLGVNFFMDLMNNIIIPKLKSQYSDNYFINSLTLYDDRNSGHLLYRMNYDIWETEDQNQLRMIQEALVDLRSIASKPSGIITANGGLLNIGEAFYLYNLIANKNMMSALTKCLTTVLNERNSYISNIVQDTYMEYDLKSSNIVEVKNLDELKLNTEYVIENLETNTYESISFNSEEELNTKKLEILNKHLRIFESSDYSILNEFKDLQIIQKAALEKNQTLTSGLIELNLNGEYIWTFATKVNSLKIADICKDLRVSYTDNLLSNGYHDFIITIPNPISDIELHFTNKTGVLFTKNAKEIIDLINYYKQTIIDKYSDNEYEEIKVPQSIKDFNKSNFKILQLINQPLHVLATSKNGYVLELKGKDPVIILPNKEIISDIELIDLLILSDLIKNKKEITIENKVNKLLEIDPSLKNQYLDYLYSAYTDQEVILHCIDHMKLLQYYLNNSDIFYLKLVEKLINHNTFNLVVFGDILTYNNLKYIYLGECNGKYILYNQETNLILLVREDQEFTLTERLKVPVGYSIPLVNIKNDQYVGMARKSETNSTDNLKTGDKLKIRGSKEVIFLDYLYEDSGTLQLLVLDGLNIYLITDKQVTSINKLKLPEKITLNQFKEFKVNSNFIDTAIRLSKNLQYGDKVKTKDGEFEYSRHISDTKIQLTNGSKVDIKDLISFIPTKFSVYDSKFIYDTTPYCLTGSHWIGLYNTTGRELALILANSLNGSFSTGVREFGDYSFLLNEYQSIVDEFGNSTSYIINSKNNFIFRLNGYHLNNATIYNVNDIIIKSEINHVGGNYGALLDLSSYDFYKIINEKNGVYELIHYTANGHNGSQFAYQTDPDEGTPHIHLSEDHYFAFNSNEDFEVIYLTEEELINLHGEHYTTVKTYSNPKLQEALPLTNLQKGSILIKFLRDKFNMEVKLVENLGVSAMIVNNTIYLNANLDEDQMIRESMHEMGHLVLAYLRLNDPELYMELTEKVNKYIEVNKLDFSEIDNDEHYPTDIDKIDEKIIRLIDQSRTNLEVSVEDIELIMNNGFKNLFNLINMTEDMKDESISHVLEKYQQDGIFTKTSSELDLLELKKSEMFKEKLSKIKRYC